MPTYFCKLNPPRPSFALDMTPEEQALMQAHAGYWQQAGAAVVAFGLVGDPAGPYGVGIVTFDDDTRVEQFTSGDPVITAQAGFRYDIHPMPFGVTRG